MTLQGTDIGLYLTTTLGAAGSSLTQTDPTLSLGKYASLSPLVSGQVGALFSTVTASQATSGYTQYRCVAVRNLSLTDIMTNASVFLADVAGGGTYAVGLDPVGIVAYNSAGAQAALVAAVTTAPVGVTFSTPTSLSVLSIGSMATGMVQLVWVKQIVGASTPGASADPVTLSIRAETV